jgi:FkbM family methyltransferase
MGTTTAVLGAPAAQLADTLRRLRAQVTAAAVRALARATPYLEAEMLGLPELIAPGSVCVDVGAAAGLYTQALSQLTGPTGQVHSIEPLAFAHPGWSRILRSYAAANVHRHQLALGARPGRENMSVPVGRHGPVTGRSFLDADAHGLGANVEFGEQLAVAVPVETLDGLCGRIKAPRLDFVKIDVEGAELFVLHGGEQVIGTFRPTLLVEIEARHTARYAHRPRDVQDWLAARGYTMHVWERGWRPADDVCAHARNYLFRPAPAAARPAA